MRRIFLATFFSATLLVISPMSAQAPAQREDQPALQLAKEVQAQQIEIAANQTKIEAKLAEIAEILRVARLFSSRSN